MGLKVFCKKTKTYLNTRELYRLLKNELLEWDYEVTFTED